MKASPLALVAGLVGAAVLLFMANLVIAGAAVLLLWGLAP
jgi:hypothetical protein